MCRMYLHLTSNVQALHLAQIARGQQPLALAQQLIEWHMGELGLAQLSCSYAMHLQCFQ